SSVGGYAFHLGGGTITINEAGVDTRVAMTLTSGTTSTIDTNGYEATFRSAISRTGNFRKTGSNQLILFDLSANKVFVDQEILRVNNLTANEVEVSKDAKLQTNAPDVGVIRLNEGVISSISGAFQLAATSRIEGV